MKRRFVLGACLLAAPASAAQLAAPLPRQLGEAERTGYSAWFQAFRAHDWTAASTMLQSLPDGPLGRVARAELYAAGDAPPADGGTIAGLIAAAPDLPEAPALALLARERGATTIAALPAQQSLVRIAGASKRQGARANRPDATAQRLAATAQPLLKAGDIAGAEALVEAAAPLLAPEATTEWRQRIAWNWFQQGDDTAARRVAAVAQEGAGDWAVQAAWVNGLAAWRAADYSAAAQAFDRVAARGPDSETLAAGLFWAARADTAGGHPQAVAQRLRRAAAYGETFYGLLAQASLGVATADVPDAGAANAALLAHPNLRAAAACVEIGETALADQLVRQQARIGPPGEHARLIAFAAALQLPATQLWLAQYAPVGTQPSVLARYPMPAWTPTGGWRLDRALLYAHALQESQFRTDAVSRAGARGLMQLMPATARLIARHKGETADVTGRLGEPSLSFEYGQSYLEELAGHWGTGGLLPKVIAAYNAGPMNVAQWNLRTTLRNDPLLFIEAIPFGETRAYVAIVLRNYWMYQRETGTPTDSMTTMAEGKWPRFPSVVQRTALASAPVTGE